MSLEKYRQKRHFNSMAEPKGRNKKSKGELHFVVHKHAASHLHYDLRLEMEGVLKSWAVPKGPSLNPEDKRLAMEVEDHPYEYKDFEGVIAEGNYGAGNVIVWDAGVLETPSTKSQISNSKDEEKKLLEGLHKGHFSFILQGKKLKGEFSLVRLNGKAKKNSWLLIKKKDKYTSEEDILKKNKSVISKKTVEQIGEKTDNPQSTIGNGQLKNLSTEDWRLATFSKLKPMLAYLYFQSFNDKNWIFEIKFDGYRAIAIIQKSNVELFSRNHISFNKRFKTIVEDLQKIKQTAVIDGEVVIEDEKGRSHFQLLQNYQKTGKGNLKYYVFDILNFNGKDTMKLPLLKRKELVKNFLRKYSLQHTFYSDHIEEKGKFFFELAKKNKLEGIIAKKADSPYRSGKRSKDWLKIKITNQEEAVIAGITPPHRSRKYFGSLLLGQYENKKFKYRGNVGTGFSYETLKDLYEKFKPYFTESSPFEKQIQGFGKIQWLKPKLVCEIKFTEKTIEGIFRHPVFVGLRMDKNAKDVHPEKTIAEKIK